MWRPQNIVGDSKPYNTLKGLDGRQIKTDSLERFMAEDMALFKIPAISIAIINDGKIIFTDNIGVSNLVTKEKVNQYSIF